MTEFVLHCINKDGQKSTLFYDRDSSVLYNSKHEVIELPFEKNFDLPSNALFKKNLQDIKYLRIKFTDECNFRCSYCLQSHGCNDYSDVDIISFVNKLPHPSNPHARIGLWGGEPFLNSDLFFNLASNIRQIYPKGDIYVASNGSLVDHKISEFINRLDISVSISHDGPGQYQRGSDPLIPPQQQEIQYLFNLLHHKDKISFNPMLTANNSSRKVINDWFISEIGHNNFTLGEGKFIYPMSLEHKDYCLVSESQIKQYALNNLREIRHNQSPNMIYRKIAFQALRDSFFQRRRIDSVVAVSMCGIHLPYRLDVDVHGNILTCQNFSPDHIMPSGETNKIGELGGPAIIDVPMATWRDYDFCVNCPIIHLCQGGCPSNFGSECKQYECNNNYADGIGFFATIIEELTGYLPYYIDGPLPEHRKSLFGTDSLDELFLM